MLCGSKYMRYTKMYSIITHYKYNNPISIFIFVEKSDLYAKITVSRKTIVSKLSYKYYTGL